ncbi:MAG: tripartite tricarboxylate transporter substrate binding protein [Betaproteobacteria bacterium]|nr:tripartite tricarboxylate transporter substrate binding protein [Betaproteobacteria bacterium]
MSIALVACALLESAGLATNVQAQSYPIKAVRFIVPSAPGGGTDIVTRVVAQKMSESMGQQFVVENRAGAGSIIGVDIAAKSPPDGYTLVMTPSTVVINPYLFKKLPFDVLRDLVAVSEAASVANVLVVHPSVPVNSVAELLALAKKSPGQLSFASAGTGSSPHMSVEVLKSMAGIELLHVPYKGTTPGLLDLLAGRVSMMMANTLTVGQHVKAGKLRALGVTSVKRSIALPEVPPIGEAGVPGYEVIQWYGTFAPAGTPREVVGKIQGEMARALRLAEVREHLARDGAEPVGSTPEEFANRVRTELDKWGRVARAANIQPE